MSTKHTHFLILYHSIISDVQTFNNPRMISRGWIQTGPWRFSGMESSKSDVTSSLFHHPCYTKCHPNRVAFCMAYPAGFEPTVFRVGVWRDIQLRYGYMLNNSYYIPFGLNWQVKKGESTNFSYLFTFCAPWAAQVALICLRIYIPSDTIYT